MWKDREAFIHMERQPVISPNSRIATIGSCFAAEIAAAMERLGLQGAMHPTGLFYTSTTVRQEIERVFGGWDARLDEPLWRVKGGWVHPFKDYQSVFPNEADCAAWSDDLDRRGDKLFRTADVIVITLGLIEAWRNPKTGCHYRQIPHPEVFPTLGCIFSRLSVADMLDDLERIWQVLHENTKARLILTVSPVPLHATMTRHDVRVANTESKARLRAAVSEFVEQHSDVLYFPSFEMVTTAERLSDFMLEDGRHVSRRGVDFILQQFLMTFGEAGIQIPEVDTSWLTAPAKTAERVQPESRGPGRIVLERLGRLMRRT